MSSGLFAWRIEEGMGCLFSFSFSFLFEEIIFAVFDVSRSCSAVVCLACLGGYGNQSTSPGPTSGFFE